MLEFLLSRLVAFVEVSITARPLAKPYYILSYPHAGLLSLSLSVCLWVCLSVGVCVYLWVCPWGGFADGVAAYIVFDVDN